MRSTLFIFLCVLGGGLARAAEPRVVENSTRGLWDENPRKSFDLLEEMFLGGDDEENDVIFGRIADITVDSRGRILVLDAGFHRVAVYDPDSMTVRFFGQKGEGPGEFNQPTAIGVDAADRIYVASMGGRIAVLNRDSTVAVEFRHLFADGFVTGLHPTTKGLYVVCFDAVEDNVVHRYDTGLGYVSSFSDSWSSSKAMPVDEERWCNGGAVDVGADGCVYYTQFTPYEIRKFSPDGKLLLTIHRDNDFKPPTIERVGDSVTLYAYTGSFGIVALPDGKILNVTARTGDDHKFVGTIFDLFDAEGRLLKTIEGRPGIWIKCRDAQGKLYASESREVPQVIRYRLNVRNQ